MKKLAIRAIFAISFLTRRTRFMLNELMLTKFVFLCRVWTENFDFSAGVDADEVTFMDPEELRLQESESGAPIRYNVHLKWQKLRGANSLPTE